SGYTPVQSRTRIFLPPEIKKTFMDAINYAIFCRLLFFFNSEWGKTMQDKIYPNYTAKGSASQMLFFESTIGVGIKDVFMNTKTPFIRQNLNIAELTNRLIRVMGDRKFEYALDDIQRTFDAFKPSAYPKVYEMIQTTVTGWLMSKNSNSSVTSNTNLVEEIIVMPPEKEIILPYVEAFLDLYDAMATKLKITNWRSKENCAFVKLYEINGSTLGYYENRTIHFNMYPYNETDIQNFINEMKSIETPQSFEEASSKIWVDWFKYSYPART